MKIPKQFRDCHFLKLAVMSKTPIAGETNWTRTAEEIEKHTGNVGLHLDSNMIVLDIDDMPSAKELGILDMSVPDTYAVRTGSGGMHLFFYCDQPERRA